MKYRQVEDPLKLIWPKFPSGYVWRSGNKGDKERYLMPSNPNEQPMGYEPLLQYTGLFRDFSELSLTEDAFRDFANSYGLLGLAHDVNRPHLLAESSFEWNDSVLRMRPLVALWRAIQTGNTHALASIGKWKDGEFLYEVGDSVRSGSQWFVPESGVIQSYELKNSGVAPGDIISAARQVLQRLVNRQLRVFPTLPALLFDREGKLRLFMQPQSLGSALWIQFSQAISENHTLRECSVCNHWFQVGGASGKRADAETCSPKCRQAKHRADLKGNARKARAKSRRQK